MSDVILRVLHRHSFRGVDNSSLGRIVPSQSRSGSNARRAGDIDKRTSFAFFLHVRNNNSARVINTPHIHIDHFIKVLVCDVVGGLVAVRGSCIINDNVAATVCIDCLFKQGFPVIEFGDIGLAVCAI